MRLLASKTLELKEFMGNNVPPYAILSHTWGGGEVSFQDITSATTELARSRIAHLQGYDKIRKCCVQAVLDGFDWVWVDTCCIDKTSSAELSEAINSMFQWYAAAAVCYAYLEDVALAVEWEFDEELFCGARWFTRGWTLQELIAPRSIIFYGRSWIEIGTKRSLEHLLYDITGIADSVLRGTERPSQYSVAQRMSWAANRQTTREEDTAYCLLGLFQVNMPMLYGEGERAFERLQKEIVQREDDYSILAWARYSEQTGDCTVFAKRPRDFRVPLNLLLEQQLCRDQFGLLALYSDMNYIPPSALEQSVRAVIPRHREIARNQLHAIVPTNFLEAIRSMQPGVLSPPFVTSRGLRITLFVREYRGSSDQLLAWTFCKVSSNLVCLLLTQNTLWNEAIGSTWFRSEQLYYVPIHEAGDFVPQQLYLSLYAPEKLDSPGQRLESLGPSMSFSGFGENGYQICFVWSSYITRPSLGFQASRSTAHSTAVSEERTTTIQFNLVNKRHSLSETILAVLRVFRVGTFPSGNDAVLLVLGDDGTGLHLALQDPRDLSGINGVDQTPGSSLNLSWLDFASSPSDLRASQGVENTTAFFDGSAGSLQVQDSAAEAETSLCSAFRVLTEKLDRGMFAFGTSDRLVYRFGNGDRLSVSMKRREPTLSGEHGQLLAELGVQSRDSIETRTRQALTTPLPSNI